MNAISNNSKPIEPKGMGKRERERREKGLLLGYHMQPIDYESNGMLQSGGCHFPLLYCLTLSHHSMKRWCKGNLYRLSVLRL